MKRLLAAIAASALLVACAHEATSTAAPPPVKAAEAPKAPAAPTAPAAAPPTAPKPPTPPTPPAVPAATPAVAAASGPTNYNDLANWLCRPGKPNDACAVNLDTTIVQADGSTSVETYKADPNAPIDCFYIYPTVSLDPTAYSDLKPGPEEFNVVKVQFARLGAKCRLFAPMYRQFTLAALRARMNGGAGTVPMNGTPSDPISDVDDAWDWYMAHENKGRGVVIVGHSQGAGQVTRLIAAKIDGRPEQKRLVSAVIMGTSLMAPKGKDVGGAFKSIPACRKADQTGCVITFSSFRSDIPPNPGAGFGASRGDNESLCTNPAALGGGKAEPKAYFSTGDKEWVTGKKVTTPFVRLPGMVTTECVAKAGHNYLEVTFKGDPKDPRIDDPGVDVIRDGKPDPAWGLHLMDANIGMGDIVDVVGKQDAAWRKANGKP